MYTIWPHESWTAWQAFLYGLGAKNEEQESKTAGSKPKIPFHRLFLLRNRTETLATKATRKFKEGNSSGKKDEHVIITTTYPPAGYVSIHKSDKLLTGFTFSGYFHFVLSVVK